MPSILSKSSKFFFFDNDIKFFKVFRFLAISLAFSKPICLIPKA